MSYSKNKVTSIQTLIQNFFLERLIQQRGVTSRTIESYRDTFKIYIKYLQEMFNISVENIDISDFINDIVLLFLKYLEENRNNKPITLNNRLSVIHTFMKYVAEQAPEYSNIAKKTIMIPYKKQETKIIENISKEELKAIKMLKKLYTYYIENPDEMSAEYRQLMKKGESKTQVVCDYLAGMTDQYSMAKFRKIYIPKAWEVY